MHTQSYAHGRQRITPEMIEAIKTYAMASIAAEGTPGMVIALTDREGLVWQRAFGFRNLDARTPMTPDTLLETGSIGKSFTAAIALQLAEEGRLDLHAPVTDALPWFEVQSAHPPITAHDLLSHTSGLIGGNDFVPDPRLEVWNLRHTSTGSAPGTYFNYSNVGYKLLGLMLEEVTGQSYAQLVRERILTHLGVSNTTPVITHHWRSRMADPYLPLFDDRPTTAGRTLAPANWFQTNTADGCLASSAADLAAWLRMLLNRGEAANGRVLSETAFQRMITPVATRYKEATDSTEEYGYGISAKEADDTLVIGHSGGMVGYSSHMTGDLDAGLGAVGIVNGPGNIHGVVTYALQVMQANFHRRPLPPAPTQKNPQAVEDAGELAGTYTSDDGTTLTLTAGGDALWLETGEGASAVRQQLQTTWYGLAVQPPLDTRHALGVERDADKQVLAVTHGAQWYAREGVEQPGAADAPPEWAAYVGTYRSHNPWHGHMAVVLRRGRLYVDGREELVPLEDGTFKVGTNPHAPERVSFDVVINGTALRATYDGEVFARFFTGDADLADMQG